jgi:lipoprotein-anchoring transpeptidase ErfK/SrfK
VPFSLGPNERWIEIDLTNQQLIAHKGDEVVRIFTISSGKWGTPTVIGQFQIYSKLTSQTMVGSDFYLPDVPFVMYFYKGYAIHGTYWHNNFGTPMSHGCINMRVSQAEWIYNFTSIGTWVVVHY